MSQEKIKHYQSRILYLLLKKYEASNAFKTGTPGLQRPQFAMHKLGDSLTKDYFDEMDYEKKERIHQAAAELQKQGIIEIKWPKFKDGQEIEKIFLQPNAIEEAYRCSGITPKKKKLEEIRMRIDPLAKHPWEWVREFWHHYDRALANHQTAGLPIDESEAFGDMVKTLLYLPQAEDGIMKRVLSHRLFNDTKHFERNVQARLVAVLKRFGKFELDTDIEILDAIGIVENPKMTLLSGPLLIEIKGEKVDISKFPGGMGVAFETIKALKIQELPAEAILLIENLTAYHMFLQHGLAENIPACLRNPEKVLVIYTGGFPHHALRKLFIKLQDFLANSCSPSIKVFHWGDIDYGGIMIFEHLRRKYFLGIIPLLMDEATYEKYAREGIPFSKEYAAKLVSMSKDESYRSWSPLIALLLEKGQRLEQEGILVEWKE